MKVLVGFVWAIVGLVVLAGLEMVVLVLLMGGCPDCPSDPPMPRQPHRHPAPGGGFVALGAGGDQTCGKTVDGQAWCWGAGSPPQRADTAPFASWAEHRLGRCVVDAQEAMHCEQRHGTEPARLEPWFDLPNVRSVVLGGEHGCAIRDDASLWCFGANESGQIAPSAPPSVTVPVRVREQVKGGGDRATTHVRLVRSRPNRVLGRR